MRERRELLRTTVEDIAQHIGVPAKHLHRIERSDWKSLPSAVYTKGFVRKYARALGMDAGRLVKEYEREVAAQKEADGTAASAETHNTFQKLFPALSISATRRTVVGLLFLALVGYIGYQLSIVFADPALSVTQPAQEEMVVTESRTVLAGRTDPGATLLLNNQQVEVGPDGSFEREVELLPGINVLEIAAVSRFNERTTVSRTVIFQEPEHPLFPKPANGTEDDPQVGENDNGTVGTTTATTSTSTEN